MIPSRLLLEAYVSGIFPMAEPGGRVLWFSPDPRGILPLERFHIPHGLRRRLARSPYDVRINTAFETVIRGCSQRDSTWIDKTILPSYLELNRLGFAHSVEAWDADGLAGGLYGVALGGAFFGESMFHVRGGASGAALIHLVARLVARQFILLDIQWTTPHLTRFGALEIPKVEYMHRLKDALRLAVQFAPAPSPCE